MRTVASHLSVAVLAVVVSFVVLHPAALHVEPGGRAPAVAAPQTPATTPEFPELTPDERINMLVYQQANRSVVNITTRGIQADDFLMLFSPRAGSGSGSVLDKQGHILTNYHVVEGADRIAVTFYDSSTADAKLVGFDAANDLAVIKTKAPADKLFPVAWGDTNKLQVGMRVFAIGNPFGLERTLTTGIVSSLNRSLRTENNRIIRGVIQTDAAINPGSSGGPLLNRRGELVGITTAIVSRAGQNSGVGLAIPASASRRIVDDLIKFGRVKRPDCGIINVSELENGLLIGRLVPAGPADRAGLRGPKVVVERRGTFEFRSVDRSKADRIVAVDGKSVKTADDLLSYIESQKAGDKVKFSIVREGKNVDVVVTLAEERE